MPTPSKIKFFYDPRGQLIRTLNPDGTEQRVIYGKPENIGSIPTWGENDIINSPWETTTYDANDLGGGAGFNTPKTEIHDALGRTVKTIDRLNDNPNENVVMKYGYDIQGNLKKVVDALDRVAFLHTYDLRPKEKGEDGKEKPQVPIQSWHIDKGKSELLSDVAGKPIEAVDAKGAEALSSYDPIGRPYQSFVKDKTGEDFTLRGFTVYSDSALSGLSETIAKGKNLFGAAYKAYDESGLAWTEQVDFKGDLLQTKRQVISDETLKSLFPSSGPFSSINHYSVDWIDPTSPADILDSAIYQTDTEFDALKRSTKITYPEDNNGDRKELLPHYNRAGQLERVVFDGTEYVKHLAYNAKGQQLLGAFGNGIMVRNAYDRLTFRLKRTRTEKFTYSESGNNIQYAYNTGTVRNDVVFGYDKKGNIISTNETTPDCGLSTDPELLKRDFFYDGIYRLIKSTGREQNAVSYNSFWENPAQTSAPHASDCRAYTERFEYDKLGNILKMVHTASSNNFTRKYEYLGGGNTLDKITDGQSTPTDLAAYTYDACGNQLTANSDRSYRWNAANELQVFINQAGSSEPSVYAHYLYSGGQRVKKMILKPGGITETVVYMGGIEYHKRTTSTTTETKTYTQVMGGVEIREGSFSDDTTDPVIYSLSDHLGSATIRLDNNGTLIDKEEYYAFGDCSLRSFDKRRYRYCGKEKDNESGLYYYGARYYEAWTGRFISVDPLAQKYNQLTPYNYAGNEPIGDKDIDGMQSEKTPEGGGEKDKNNNPLPAVRSSTKVKEKEVHLIFSDFAKQRLAIKKNLELKEADEFSNYNVKIDFKNQVINITVSLAESKESQGGFSPSSTTVVNVFTYLIDIKNNNEIQQIGGAKIELRKDYSDYHSNPNLSRKIIENNVPFTGITKNDPFVNALSNYAKEHKEELLSGELPFYTFEGKGMANVIFIMQRFNSWAVKDVPGVGPIAAGFFRMAINKMEENRPFLQFSFKYNERWSKISILNKTK